MNGLGRSVSHLWVNEPNTYLTDVVTSPNSFFSDICRNWIAACCLEHEGWEMGMSVT